MWRSGEAWGLDKLTDELLTWTPVLPSLKSASNPLFGHDFGIMLYDSSCYKCGIASRIVSGRGVSLCLHTHARVNTVAAFN